METYGVEGSGILVVGVVQSGYNRADWTKVDKVTFALVSGVNYSADLD